MGTKARDRSAYRLEKLAALELGAEGVKPDGTWEVLTNDSTFVLLNPVPYGARLIFADPPYNLGIDYGEGHNDALGHMEYLRWSAQWISSARFHLTDDGSLWILINHEWADSLSALTKSCGLHLRQRLTWYESFGVNTTRKFNRCSRTLLWLVKDPKNFVFNREAVTRPSDRQVKYKDRRANPAGKCWDDIWGLNPPIPRLTGTCKERLPDVPTQLPVKLLLPIVGCASDPGDLVIDPFSGSGTTGAACIRLGRRYLGVELSEKFVALSHLRLLAEQKARTS